jgi:hypothetical protein
MVSRRREGIRIGKSRGRGPSVFFTQIVPKIKIPYTFVSLQEN